MNDEKGRFADLLLKLKGAIIHEKGIFEVSTFCSNATTTNYISWGSC